VLGPSHHEYTPKCALTQCEMYETPLGNIAIDMEACATLRATGEFEDMALSVDEAEHSIEMHLPYIVQVMGKRPFKLVPILVGALSSKAEAAYGKLLAPLLLDPENAFIISSDFCHWGRRFRFTHYDPKEGEIYQSIEALDKQGMALIEAQDPSAFAKYQAEFGNTICGRHPIAVLLHMLKQCESRKHQLRFIRYAQSSRVTRMADSSVSYASAVAW